MSNHPRVDSACSGFPVNSGKCPYIVAFAYQHDPANGHHAIIAECLADLHFMGGAFSGFVDFAHEGSGANHVRLDQRVFVFSNYFADLNKDLSSDG